MSPQELHEIDSSENSDSLKVQVYKKLRFFLMTGRYAPGERIVIEKVSKELGVSRTPVREALLMLVQQNVLDMKASSSCRVPEPSVERYIEGRKIRSELQCLAAREAMRHMDRNETARVLEDLHNTILSSKDSGDIQTMLDSNRQFNMTIIRQSKMPQLISMIEALWMQVGPLVKILFTENPPQFTGPHPHVNIITGIRRNNTEAVCQAIRDLLEEGGDFMIALLEQRALRSA